MSYLRSKPLILYFISGVIAAYSVLHASLLFSWLCYIPLFFLLRKASKKYLFKEGFIFGLGASVVSFFWMIGAAKEFSGNNVGYGIFITSLSVFWFCIYWSLLIAIFCFLAINKKIGRWAKAFTIAACFTLGECLLSLCFSQAPYYLFNSGYGLLNNLYSLQWASFFGLSFLNFVVVLVNVWIAEALTDKNWKTLYTPLIFITVIFVGGFMMFSAVKQRTDNNKTIKLAIVSENVPPELHWDRYGGNILAGRLLSLNRTAQALNPDITFWAECAIPWTYSADDALIKEILKVSKQSKSTQLIGCNSEYSKNQVFNSMYGFSSDGKILGRYDKRYLLSFIETPTLGLSVPFFDLAGSFIKAGGSSKPLVTSVGKAGVIICNEVVNPVATLTVVKEGADFLLNPSNDGWFKDSYIVELHFLYARLSAVINRRDIVINSNYGVSSHIKASGEIQMKRKSKEMFVQMVDINPTTFDNSRYYSPFVTICFCFIIISFSLFNIVFHKKIPF
ncbi:MAG TPA: apolipoprotein N-acyltransferase [Pelobium sp.]|nr:apolipoprotein N-acyltransferase [Pelobium sp.]